MNNIDPSWPPHLFSSTLPPFSPLGRKFLEPPLQLVFRVGFWTIKKRASISAFSRIACLEIMPWTTLLVTVMFIIEICFICLKCAFLCSVNGPRVVSQRTYNIDIGV